MERKERIHDLCLMSRDILKNCRTTSISACCAFMMLASGGIAVMARAEQVPSWLMVALLSAGCILGIATLIMDIIVKARLCGLSYLLEEIDEMKDKQTL